ncbi:hypothetical protein KC717_01165 [Candidatus Dojkabacteria bacterium]|uniref:LPXTG cell wall anchor domain-containing protein n=1 Tax=Candidatus Dojkabacteria bacterium TaxID=2099670 RepID=A0A955L7U5_9BACT|nr:hypothetical protein [Candidatus Dojkabacteria bacterium]
MLFSSLTFAQTASGTLSFSPTSVDVSTSGTTPIEVVYTGTEITAAEVHVNVGSSLSIESFDTGDLVAILSDPANGEIHVGKLTQGNITSGSTLFTMEVRANICGENGTITFDQIETIVPDVTLSFNSATYTTCGGGGTSTGGSTGGTPSVLPRTDITDSTIGTTILTAVVLMTTGLGAALLTLRDRETEEDISIIVR